MRYKNELGDYITEQQVNGLDNYRAITYSNDRVKKIEAFAKIRNGNRKSIFYFLDAEENKQDIINQYSDVEANINCIVYFNKQSSGTFNLWDWEGYTKEGALKFKGQETYDDKNRVIFSCSFDLITNHLEDNVFKYFYGNQFEGNYRDILLTFLYKSNGEIELIYDTNENYGYMKGISLSEYLNDTEFSQEQFPWDQHPYYHSAYPFLPEGDL